MPSIRRSSTASGATAIQVVRYIKRKVKILKHIGSAHTPEEIEALMRSAEQWMKDHTDQMPLFMEESVRVFSIAHASFNGVRYAVAQKTLLDVAERCGFHTIKDDLLVHLALIRIFEPCSKRRSRELLERYFGIVYAERTLYRALKTIVRHKQEVERLAVACAKKEFSFDCSLVLYDVTTLYFESFREDEEETALRKKGFSKDQKSQQPQLVIGLLVTSQGFPLGYEVFKGNTFEGHTMLPVLERFKEAHQVISCTVVADAGMLSLKNIEELRAKKLSYIVGARVANLSPKILKQVTTTLNRMDKATMRLDTQHGDLVCSFSQERFRKDAHDLEKQIARAKKILASKIPEKRAKFIQTSDAKTSLNEALIAKTEKLLGIKGYVTNIAKDVMSDQEIMKHYRNLWQVEHAFRMAKSDLEVRPIFHHKEETIRAHLVICFVALVMSQYMEIKSGLSIRRMMDLLRLAGDARIIDTASGKEFIIPAKRSEELCAFLRTIGVSY